METIKIGMGNGHNKAALVDLVRKSHCDSFSAHEAQQILPAFKKMTGVRVTVAGQHWGEERNRAKETCVLTKRSNENIGEMTRLVSEKVPAVERVAPDRVLVVSMYQHPVARRAGYDGIAHFGLHPNASPDELRDPKSTSPAVREYEESIRSTARLMTVFKRDGLLPILSGDLNLPENVITPWSPRRVFVNGLNMKYVVHGVDWILWSRRDLIKLSHQWHPLFDHHGITAIFKANRED